jgi:hypothetical protein
MAKRGAAQKPGRWRVKDRASRPMIFRHTVSHADSEKKFASASHAGSQPILPNNPCPSGERRIPLSVEDGLPYMWQFQRELQRRRTGRVLGCPESIARRPDERGKTVSKSEILSIPPCRG